MHHIIVPLLFKMFKNNSHYSSQGTYLTFGRMWFARVKLWIKCHLLLKVDTRHIVPPDLLFAYGFGKSTPAREYVWKNIILTCFDLVFVIHTTQRENRRPNYTVSDIPTKHTQYTTHTNKHKHTTHVWYKTNKTFASMGLPNLGIFSLHSWAYRWLYCHSDHTPKLHHKTRISTKSWWYNGNEA